mmetsp:Transcript_54541/g.100951  ORF Transcript_54541/g.100951 Transcript_54541/m.100951 type:complete len:167 (-) Transcript_54541:51-551(-)
MKRPREGGEDEDDSKQAGADAPATVIETKGDFWRLQLEAVYNRRNPRKLAALPALLEKYKGDEATLYVKVCKTYDLDPKKLYTDPSSWEEYDGDTLEEEPGAADTAAGEGVIVPDLFNFAAGPRKQAAKPDLSSSDDEPSGKARGKPSDPAGASSAQEQPAECKTQ